MLFNSYHFILFFLPATLIGYLFINGFFSSRVVNIWLIVTSLYFYSWSNSADILIILTSIGMNYFFSRSFSVYPQHRKTLLKVIILLNITVLVFYKYLAFINASLNQLMPVLHLPVIQRELPLAISFFTFQQISFIVDRYRQHAMPVAFEKYSTAVVFFPHLIAGPLVEYKKLIPQFFRKKRNSHLFSKILIGLFVFTIGLSKKILLADQMLPLVNAVFSGGQNLVPLNLISTWIGVLAYSLQLYFDFSGYSDMAVGLGLMFGISLPANFNSPYKATSIIEFWRRWHISLSNFLRDYLYIPLGGSRDGIVSRYRNLFLTMLIGGAWHGAGWNFIIWGAWHGVLLILNHLWRDTKLNSVATWGKQNWIFSQICWGITFLSVLVGWVFFRSPDMSTATTVLRNMFTLTSDGFGGQFTGIVQSSTTPFAVTLIAFFISRFGPNTWGISRYLKCLVYKGMNPSRQLVTTLIFSAIFMACLLMMSKPMTFIYYQF